MLYDVLMADIENPKGIVRVKVRKEGRLTLSLLVTCLNAMGFKGPGRRRDGRQSDLCPTSVIRILALVGREWRGIAEEIFKRDRKEQRAQYFRVKDDDPAASDLRDGIISRTMTSYKANDRSLLEHLYRCLVGGVLIPDYLGYEDRFMSFREFVEARYQYEGKRFYYDGDVNDHWQTVRARKRGEAAEEGATV